MEQQPKIEDKYRFIFRSPLGQDILGDILVNLCHFGCTLDPENKVQVSEYNVGIAILAKMGVFGPNKIQEVVQALCSIAPSINLNPISGSRIVNRLDTNKEV